MTTYRDRLANVLEVDTPSPTAVSPMQPFPRVKKPENKIKLTLNEFYQLSDCPLYSLVAERNTTLGRLQAPSTRYHYEQRLLHALKRCADNTEDSKLKTKLNQWYRLKQQQRAQNWYWLLGSEELRHGLSRNQGWLSAQPKHSDAVESWRYLQQMRPPSARDIDLAILEQHLKRIADAHVVSRVIRTQRYLAQQLPAFTQWLEQHRPECTNDSAQYLRNVFGRFFIERIQPVGARLNHYHYRLNPMLDDLYRQPGQPEAIVRWLDSYWLQGFQEYQTAMQEHIQWWQDFFKQCELAPPTAGMGLGPT
ncbi:DUF3080 family protein [Saliniradius amylolyticus]|uniref:DUF3080 family protein n=1 Tax=Saliniradius amylolyticus TaxID=2183582 RepID=UPI0013A5A506|nr:DUF3080 family protein [Saliniradius amylolyticus]